MPKWTHLQVKSLCGGTLSYVKVSQALLKMFGGDHKPNLTGFCDSWRNSSSLGEARDGGVEGLAGLCDRKDQDAG